MYLVSRMAGMSYLRRAEEPVSQQRQLADLTVQAPNLALCLQRVGACLRHWRQAGLCCLLIPLSWSFCWALHACE